MDKIINFRASIDTFNEHEFELFCTKLYQDYNKRQLIIKSLFYLLLNDSKHNKYENAIKLNQITKTIMDSRKKKTVYLSHAKSTKKNTEISINNLPSQLIAYTSSYLHLSEQTSLITCNRYICASLLSSTSRINQLSKKNWFDLYKENHGPQYIKYQMNKLNRFRMVTKMCIQRKNVQDLYEPFAWHNLCLHTLQLREFFISSNFDKRFLDAVKNVTKILHKIDFKHLVISVFYFLAINNDMKLLFQQFFEASKKIECLTIDRMYCHDVQSMMSCIVPLCQILKGLIISETERIIPQILPILGQQLMSLHLGFGLNNTQQITFEHDNKFVNLEELCLNERISLYLLTYFINCTVKLRRFNWKILNNFPAESIKNILEIILTKRIDMKYLSIDSSIDSFKILKDLFISCKNIMKRDIFKIRWHFSDEINVKQIKYLSDNLANFVNALNKSVVKDFMFIFRINVKKKTELEELRIVLNEIQNSYSVRMRSLDIVNEKNEIKMIQTQTVICNINNGMNGYQESWMYTCKHCNIVCAKE